MIDGAGVSGVTSVNPDMEKPKKKRGRPKKVDQQQSDDGPSKPKRGRPRKKAAEPEVTSSEDDTEATEDNDEETGRTESQLVTFRCNVITVIKKWVSLCQRVGFVRSSIFIIVYFFL